MALWQLMHLGTGCTVPHCLYKCTKECPISKARRVILVVISDHRHTECSSLTEAKWVSYICNHGNNVPSRLSPQWLCGNSCTSAHDLRFHIAGTNEPKSAQNGKQGAQ